MFKNHYEFLKLFRYDPEEDKYYCRIDKDIKSEDEWVCVSKEVWYMRRKDAQNEYKRSKREKRCLVPGSNGKLIRCDEAHDCNACPYAKGYAPDRPNFGERSGGAVSLEAAAESGSQFADPFDMCEWLEKKELYEALYKAIRSLDEESYHIILLYGGGMSEREIGKRMGLSQKAVNYRKAKIFAQLREALKDFR